MPPRRSFRRHVSVAFETGDDEDEDDSEWCMLPSGNSFLEIRNEFLARRALLPFAWSDSSTSSLT